MSARSSGVEWGETVEEVVITEERQTPENNSPEGDKSYLMMVSELVI